VQLKNGLNRMKKDLAKNKRRATKSNRNSRVSRGNNAAESDKSAYLLQSNNTSKY
jgi:hypothetical protein